MVRQLADDPDDLLRQLQILAAEAGGDPSATQITVDGFQATTVLPSKGSIASIRINPDLFSSEYPWPPFSGGLVEITTKPGASSLHGSLFFTGNDGAWNATTAFAPTSTPASKRRYGFELSGNLIPRRSDFSMSLEKRDIDEFRVVNAQTLSSDYVITPFRQTVPTPQRLWMGLFRNGWQLTPGDTFTGVFTANVNQFGNQGVSALVLPESGYTNYASKYDLRFSNALTVGSAQLHQTRLGLTWWRTQNTPNSSAPSLQVAGYFTSGGAINQNLNDHGFNIEFDHDVLLTKGRSSLKFGTQMQTILSRNYEPNTFNGAWLFSSMSAPVLDTNDNPTSTTTTIDGMEAYRRTLLGLPGGGPTTYQVTTGGPNIPFTQWTQPSTRKRRFRWLRGLPWLGDFAIRHRRFLTASLTSHHAWASRGHPISNRSGCCMLVRGSSTISIGPEMWQVYCDSTDSVSSRLQCIPPAIRIRWAGLLAQSQSPRERS